MQTVLSDHHGTVNSPLFKFIDQVYFQHYLLFVKHLMRDSSSYHLPLQSGLKLKLRQMKDSPERRINYCLTHGTLCRGWLLQMNSGYSSRLLQLDAPATTGSVKSAAT